MSECVFCKIAQGEIPSAKVAESAQFVVFMDAFPAQPGHMLIIPKVHFSDVLEAPDDVLQEMMVLGKQVGAAALKALDAGGLNISFNVGKVAGQEVPHVHLHVIPRKEGDGGIPPMSERPKPAVEELQQVADSIISALE